MLYNSVLVSAIHHHESAVGFAGGQTPRTDSTQSSPEKASGGPVTAGRWSSERVSMWALEPEATGTSVPPLRSWRPWVGVSLSEPIYSFVEWGC